MTRSNNNQFLLRTALRGNAAFSVVSGALFIVFAVPSSEWAGLNTPWILRAVGGSLIVFAAGLVRNAARPQVNRAEAWSAVAMDFAWVAGTGVVLAAGWLSGPANWAAAALADVVLVFGCAQLAGLMISREHSVRAS